MCLSPCSPVDRPGLLHAVLDHVQSHEALLELADSITLDEVNAVCQSLLSFASHYGREDALAESWRSNPEEWRYEPTRTTSIIACVPAYMDASGSAHGGGAGMSRGGVTTGQHLDEATIASLDVDSVVDPLASDDDEWGPPPEGAVKFDLSAEQIQVGASGQAHSARRVRPNVRDAGDGTKLSALLHFFPMHPIFDLDCCWAPHLSVAAMPPAPPLSVAAVPVPAGVVSGMCL